MRIGKERISLFTDDTTVQKTQRIFRQITENRVYQNSLPYNPYTIINIISWQWQKRKSKNFNTIQIAKKTFINHKVWVWHQMGKTCMGTFYSFIERHLKRTTKQMQSDTMFMHRKTQYHAEFCPSQMYQVIPHISRVFKVVAQL